MASGRSLGRQFGWLWAAYAVSAYGSGFGFGAFPLIAILVLHAAPAAVSALSATGLAAGALIAVPLGPWVEFRRKRPVMMAMDLTRFGALMSVPAAFALGWLSFAQLLVVSVIVAAAKITFNAASGACLKAVVRPQDLLVATGRFESTAWTAIVVGPPLGGAAIGLFGPVTTVLADAVSYLLSAAGIRAIGGLEPRPPKPPRPSRPAPRRARAGDLLDGWRYILAHPAFARVLQRDAGQRPDHGDRAADRDPHARPPRVPAVAIRAGLRRTLRRRCDRVAAGRSPGGPVRPDPVLLAAGTLRVCWPLGLAFVRPGAAGLVLVIVVQFGLVTSCAVFNPLSPPAGSTTAPRTGSPAPWPRGRSAAV